MKLDRVLRILIVVWIWMTITSCSSLTRSEITLVTDDAIVDTPEVIRTSVPTIAPTNVVEATATPVVNIEPIPALRDVMWQDSFEDQTSGWEPRYEVKQTDYNRVDPTVLRDTRLHAWNGYDNGGYRFYLPGIPELAGDTAAMLWDFNPSYQLPAYPYRVRADVSVSPAGNGMLLLDYAGDFGAIDKGDGVAVIWGHSDGRSYKYVDVWDLTVYEFHNGRTWALGCSSDELSRAIGPRSSAVVDVDATAITVTIYRGDGAPHTATCARVQSGRSDVVRYLGIGAVYARPVLPANDYGSMLFEDVYVLAGESVMGGAAAYPEITGGCVPAWMGYWDNEQSVDVVSAIESQTDCRNGYASFSSDFPGYGVERIAMPNADMLTGAWACGGDAPTSRFRFERRGGDVMLMVGDSSRYVYYAKDVEDTLRGYAITDVPTEAYIVTDSTRGGNIQTFESVDVVQIGDGISVRGQHNFYFTIEGDTIVTNWTALPCTRE
ncbi:MAG: hypothetical protein ACO3F2_06400 [Roseiflexaceae bacterium]